MTDLILAMLWLFGMPWLLIGAIVLVHALLDHAGRRRLARARRDLVMAQSVAEWESLPLPTGLGDELAELRWVARGR